MSITTRARWIGLLYLSAVPFGPVALIYVPKTVHSLIASGGGTVDLPRIDFLLRLGVAANMIEQVVIVLAALGLYYLFAPVSRSLGLVMLAFAVISAAMGCLNEGNWIAAARLLHGLPPGPIPSAVTADLGLRTAGITACELFWGLWLLPLAILVIRSGFVPRIVGILIGLAGIAYIADWFTMVLIPEVNLPLDAVFSLELALPLWLAVMSVNASGYARAADAKT
jgi:hypothetical protein